MIPIMKPLLPNVDSLLPYLKRIDESRWYSNFGPLVTEYEKRLADMFGCYVVSCASGTVGLTAALMAVTRRGDAVAMPGWTFCATKSAIEMAGCKAVLCDVDSDGVLDADALMRRSFNAICPVLPLGAPIDIKWWEGLGVPVVFDAAAAFDPLGKGLCGKIGKSPVVVSTHTTKVFGTGEGGFVLCADAALIERIRLILNQGMLPNKTVAMAGFNGKMSEYHAAVGLAELDGWKEKRAKWEMVGRWYGEGVGYVTSTHPEVLDTGIDVNNVVALLSAAGVMCRASWYGVNCERLKTTRELNARTIFLPKSVDMSREDVEKIKTIYGRR